jgi:hypothetical protein
MIPKKFAMARAPSFPQARDAARSLPFFISDRLNCHTWRNPSPDDDVAHRFKRKLNFLNFGFGILAVDFPVRASVEKQFNP